MRERARSPRRRRSCSAQSSPGTSRQSASSFYVELLNEAGCRALGPAPHPGPSRRVDARVDRLRAGRLHRERGAQIDLHRRIALAESEGRAPQLRVSVEGSLRPASPSRSSTCSRSRRRSNRLADLGRTTSVPWRRATIRPARARLGEVRDLRASIDTASTQSAQARGVAPRRLPSRRLWRLVDAIVAARQAA